jgi:hypothetical protein
VTRSMYDAIYADDLPPGADLYAGYVDGDWPDANAIAERFPGVRVVRVATSPSTNDGVVGDGPPDNGTWAQWVAWVVMRRRAGVDPTMYADAADWAAGIAAFQAAGVPLPHWWIAEYDGDPTIPAGAIAKQYASNEDFDTSSVADYWPGVDPAPAPQDEEDSMYVNTSSVNGRAGMTWNQAAEIVLQAQYAGAGALALDWELKLTTGPVYSADNGGPWELAGGTGVFHIPAQWVAACRGVILTLHAGTAATEYDVIATV